MPAPRPCTAPCFPASLGGSLTQSQSPTLPADGAPARTDLKLDASDLRLTLSPDVLELGSALAASALAPLMQPKPDQPLASCTQFERVWSFDPAELFAGQQSGQLAVSLAVTGAEGGVTVWRAKTPTGYGVAGDIVTPGASQVRAVVRDAALGTGGGGLPVPGGAEVAASGCCRRCMLHAVPPCLCSPHLRCWPSR